ncbi:hypothetical protein P3T76_001376 [Phytophthora citrophthora]|uniref:Uncharacterized protein n=1 Tax=Phytophthora citrophthora TaxID=4793 RepID=A0AAD9GZA6_9STRA|nr:hypothetical protein P3T76_001376 [Phytophthora citrophthora]
MTETPVPHHVPVDCEFPTRINVKTLWKLWNYGDRSCRIWPYQYLANVVLTPQHKMRLTKAKMVMAQISSIIKTAPAPTQHCRSPRATSVPSIEVVTALRLLRAQMLTQLYGNCAPRTTGGDIERQVFLYLMCKYRKSNKEC